MAKQRKTRKEKIRSSARAAIPSGFVINEDLLKTKVKKNKTRFSTPEKGYFKADLTKTLILTMLVLALELALWQYLLRQ